MAETAGYVLGAVPLHTMMGSKQFEGGSAAGPPAHHGVHGSMLASMGGSMPTWVVQWRGLMAFSITVSFHLLLAAIIAMALAIVLSAWRVVITLLVPATQVQPLIDAGRPPCSPRAPRGHEKNLVHCTLSPGAAFGTLRSVDT